MMNAVTMNKLKMLEATHQSHSQARNGEPVSPPIYKIKIK